MWEILAPIVRWPLYSPTRFIGVVLAVLVAVFVVGEVNDDARGPVDVAASPTATPEPASSPWTSTSVGASPSGTASLSAAATTGGTDELAVNPADDDPSAAAADAAAAFVAAWARPDLDASAWAADVHPLVTSELWTDGLSVTDPASTPDVLVAAEPRQVAINAEEAVFDVPTTGAWVRVHLVPDVDGAWLVSRVEPAS